MLAEKDSQGNTIAHLVAASGNTEVFKVQYLQYIGMEGNGSIFIRCVYCDKHIGNDFCYCGKHNLLGYSSIIGTGLIVVSNAR